MNSDFDSIDRCRLSMADSPPGRTAARERADSRPGSLAQNGASADRSAPAETGSAHQNGVHRSGGHLNGSPLKSGDAGSSAESLSGPPDGSNLNGSPPKPGNGRSHGEATSGPLSGSPLDNRSLKPKNGRPHEEARSEPLNDSPLNNRPLKPENGMSQGEPHPEPANGSPLNNRPLIPENGVSQGEPHSEPANGSPLNIRPLIPENGRSQGEVRAEPANGSPLNNRPLNGSLLKPENGSSHGQAMSGLDNGSRLDGSSLQPVAGSLGAHHGGGATPRTALENRSTPSGPFITPCSGTPSGEDASVGVGSGARRSPSTSSGEICSLGDEYMAFHDYGPVPGASREAHADGLGAAMGGGEARAGWDGEEAPAEGASVVTAVCCGGGEGEVEGRMLEEYGLEPGLSEKFPERDEDSMRGSPDSFVERIRGLASPVSRKQDRDYTRTPEREEAVEVATDAAVPDAAGSGDRTAGQASGGTLQAASVQQPFAHNSRCRQVSFDTVRREFVISKPEKMAQTAENPESLLGMRRPSAVGGSRVDPHPARQPSTPLQPMPPILEVGGQHDVASGFPVLGSFPQGRGAADMTSVFGRAGVFDRVQASLQQEAQPEPVQDAFSQERAGERDGDATLDLTAPARDGDHADPGERQEDEEEELASVAASADFAMPDAVRELCERLRRRQRVRRATVWGAFAFGFVVLIFMSLLLGEQRHIGISVSCALSVFCLCGALWTLYSHTILRRWRHATVMRRPVRLPDADG